MYDHKIKTSCLARASGLKKTVFNLMREITIKNSLLPLPLKQKLGHH